MRKQIGILLFFWLLIFNVGYSQELTLDSCVRLAKANNLELKQVRLNIDNAQAVMMEAKASYYPSIGLSGSYRASGRFSDSTDVSENFSSGINASYTIYKGGSIRAGSKIAKIKVGIAEENYRQKEAEVILSVKQAFYKILQTQEQMILINDILKRRNDNLILLKLNYSAGRENQSNLEQAEVNVKQTEYDFMKAEQNLALAKLRLSRLIGQENQDISIIYEDKPIVLPQLDSLILIAKTNRSEIIIEKANRDMLEAQLIQAKSNCLPSVSVSSSYGLQGDAFLKQSSSWNAGIGLSLPLFNGFSTQAKVNQVKVSIKQNELKMFDLINNIETEIRQVYSDWQMYEKNLEVSQKHLSATRKAYQLTKLQYEQGRTSYFFLSQKESELTNAENSYVNALYNLRSSFATLEKVIGRSM